MVDAIDQTIEGKKLEESQKEAIRAPGDNICVNAGAGSGKTLTILGKLIDILDKKLAKPNEILVMAFNRNVAEDLQKRVAKLGKEFPNLSKDLEKISIAEGTERKIHTFHSFCFNEVKKKENKMLAEFLQITKKKYYKKNSNEEKEIHEESDDDNDARGTEKSTKFFNDIIEELVEKDKKFSNIIIQYFLEYLKRYQNIFSDITTMEDYEKFASQRLVPLYSSKYRVGKVNSVEECEIANFLFLRGIEYIYEDPYPKDKIPVKWKRYKPDFHLIKKDEKGNIIYDVYLEHFALDKNGNPPYFFTDREYKKKYFDKIELHKKNNTKLICTYSHQKLDGTLHNCLTEELRKKRIPIPDENIMSNEEALKAFKKNNSPTEFSKLMRNFITNFKTRELTVEKIKKRSDELFDGYEKRKADAFIYLFETFLDAYNKNLKSQSENGSVDFEDMLILGRKYTELEKLKFLIIDEFQDISPLRASIIKKLKKQHNFKFFCVGDDWQSIYRFSGAELGIMVSNNEFKKFFGTRELFNLKYTYRFDDRLCEASSNFILKNEKGQLKKTVKSAKSNIQNPIEIFLHDKIENDFSLRKHVIEKLEELFKKHQNDEKPIEILFLSRFNYYTYTNAYTDLKNLVKDVFANKSTKIKFSTVHKAKGAEADYVFLMNVNNRNLGFPANIDDDRILKLVVENIDIFPNEEERRLFYVALTRTKKKIFIYGSDGNNCSSFISEILSPNKDIKENHHYINNPIRHFPRPKVLLKIHWINPFIKPENPAKKKGIKKGFMIEGINDVKKLDLTSFHQEIRNSKGKEITLLIRTDQNEPEIMKIKPVRLNAEDEGDAKYTLGFSAQEKEQDPLFLELEKKYKRLPRKNINVRK